MNEDLLFASTESEFKISLKKPPAKVTTATKLVGSVVLPVPKSTKSPKNTSIMNSIDSSNVQGCRGDRLNSDLDVI